MAHLSLNQQTVYLTFLLQGQAELLARSRAAALFVPKLRETLDLYVARQSAVAPAVVSPARLAAAARLQDQRRTAVLRLAELLELQDSGSAVEGLAASIRGAVDLPRGRAYVDRVARLTAAQARAEALRGPIAALPAALAGMLEASLAAYLAAGRELAELLRIRAESAGQGAEMTPGDLVARVSATTSLLRHFREAVRLEAEVDSTLPRDIDARLFAYLDELQAQARGRLASRRAHASGRVENSPPTVPAAQDPAALAV
jgi:hypothetical protein